MAHVLKSPLATFSLHAALLVGVMSLGARGARAENGDVGALRRELKELRQAVERLSFRVDNLERHATDRAAPSESAAAPAPGSAAPPAPRAEAVSPTPGVSIAKRWRNMQRGLSTEQVEAVLGRPQRIVPLTGRTVWYYVYPDVGNGSVVFTEDGSVIDWQAPPFNTWWGF